MNHPGPMNWFTRILLVLWCLALILMATTDLFEPYRGREIGFVFWLAVGILVVSYIGGNVIDRWRR